MCVFAVVALDVLVKNTTCTALRLSSRCDWRLREPQHVHMPPTSNGRFQPFDVVGGVDRGVGLWGHNILFGLQCMGFMSFIIFLMMVAMVTFWVQLVLARQWDFICCMRVIFTSCPTGLQSEIRLGLPEMSLLRSISRFGLIVFRRGVVCRRSCMKLDHKSLLSPPLTDYHFKQHFVRSKIYSFNYISELPFPTPSTFSFSFPSFPS